MLQGHGEFRTFPSKIRPLLTLLRLKKLRGLTQMTCYEPAESSGAKQWISLVMYKARWKAQVGLYLNSRMRRA